MNMRLAPAALLLVLGLAACGGTAATDDGVVSASGASGPATTKPAASPSATMDPQEAALKFAQCMREHGIDMPDPSGDGGIEMKIPQGTSQDKVEKAHKACEPIMKSVVRDAEPPSEEDYDRMVKFAQCMRQQGIDMPDPKPGEGLRIKMKGGSKEKLDAAHKACQEHAPGFVKKDGGTR
ncbi:hypothetical protein [Nonomuraea basaltis]|uniref:hypothetical protein n=1 Tax=Nonomuraea basaltis TaxID=2495887 RepID=UPI00110C690A|nr:hypothetical protein [Nonomuraea basaltis]TMR91587.1 hypothetical protein EJK15_49165 [Nonomuraea basaltis]